MTGPGFRLAALAVTLLAAIAFAGTPAAAAPYTAGRGTLTLSTSTVGPGGRVTANAGGYAAGGEVRILVGDATAATVRGDGKGLVAAEFTVPDGVRGQVEVRALGLDPDRATRVLTAPLTVLDGNAGKPAAAAAPDQAGDGGGAGGGTVGILLTAAALLVVGAALAATRARRRAG
ncbi:hypothetical protein RB614_28800 [Phytohabitans sp. ZYX-F-186]|uniref:Uncharacterized protein n=1 Tax=Phytohabitans maris TaxID=3071409 RepID=A0ABU0ZNB2_9ACTN|nr:hypothetical protein [Phytohabitans sp. ZYX-F-186]MDQ7908536.1 hypothetical protein [Phytohabitans sp. ZYX-F-186]